MSELLFFVILVIAVTGFRIVEVRADQSPGLLKVHDLWLRCLSAGTVATLLTAVMVAALIALMRQLAPSDAVVLTHSLLSHARQVGFITSSDMVIAAALAISALSFLVAPVAYRLFIRPPRLAPN